MDNWLTLALECGFTRADFIDIETLRPVKAVRDMCAADTCGAYGKNWTCPPHCGTLEECAQKLRGYGHGLLVQTVRQLEKRIDTRGYAAAEEKHRESLRKLYRLLRREYPDALCLGAGGCRVCAVCAYPESCRFPEEAMSSMEGYGLFVTGVCWENDIPYYHGEKTIAYFACLLFD